jgi:hypothetical protein
MRMQGVGYLTCPSKIKKPKSMNQRLKKSRDVHSTSIYSVDFTTFQHTSIHFNPGTLHPLQDQTEQHASSVDPDDPKLYQMVQQQMYPGLSDKFRLLFEVTSGSLAAAFHHSELFGMPGMPHQVVNL